MAEERRVQSPGSGRCSLLVLLGAVAIAIAIDPVRALFEPVGADVTDPAIRKSSRLPALLWCLGAPLALGARPRVPGARLAWGVGCLLLWLHIAVAFHRGHGWSHRAAWEHTREVGGSGSGVYVNYAFALVWLADALWVWVAPGSYIDRPRWLHWSVHGFLAFVVFNAAVVFAGWETRVLFVSWGLVVALWVWQTRPAPRV